MNLQPTGCGGCAGTACGTPANEAELGLDSAYVALSALPDTPLTKTESEMRGDYTPPYRLPFLLGVYLAVNAIPDAAVIVDGPDCLFFKAEIVHGKHDRNSTLLDVDGRHRVAVSHVYTDNVATSKGERVRDLLLAMDATNFGVVLVSALPMVSIIGTHYDQILRDIGTKKHQDLLEVPSKSLHGDWLDGYTDCLTVLARGLKLGPIAPKADTVAVIGYFMKRTEEDAVGDVRELRRLVTAMGLTLSTVWLSNESCADLGRVSEAQTLLALPMGKTAANELAKRTGADVVEVEVPFGLGRTLRFLRTIGDATGRRDEAEAVIQAELRRVIPRLEWVVPHTFLGTRVAFSGAPDLWAGFVQMATDLGMEVVHLSAPCEQPLWMPDLSDLGPLPPLFFNVSSDTMRSEATRLSEEADLFIAPSTTPRPPSTVAYVEYGFPSNTHHAIHHEPSLGFDGFLCFAQRMSNAVERQRSLLRQRQ